MAGRRSPRESLFSTAMCVDDRREPSSTAMDDAMLLEDFVEFLSDRDDETSVDAPIDPDFQERLRRRLWRSFALTRWRASDEIH